MAGFRNLLLVLTLFGTLTNFGYSLDGPHSFVRRVKDSEKKDDIRRLLSSQTKSGASQLKLESTLPELNNVAQIIQQSVEERLSRHMSSLKTNRGGTAAPPVRREAVIQPPKRRNLNGGARTLQALNITSLNITALSTNVTEDTIATILQQILPQIIQLVISTLAQAIIAAIIAALTGAAALVQPSGRKLEVATVNSTKPVATNTTEDTVATILTQVLQQVLPQIIDLVISTLAQSIIDAIIALLTGASALIQPGSRQMQVAVVNSTKPVATNTTEDTIVPILTQVLQEVVPQIIDLVISTLAQAIIDFLVGLVTGASISGESTTSGAPTPESSIVVKEIATNISASVNNVTSAGGQVSEETISTIIAGLIPQLVAFGVTAVSDAILGIISGFISNQDILALISGYLDILDQLIIDFILSTVGVASTDAAGSTNTTGLTEVVSSITTNITAAASAGPVTPDTVQDILAGILPQIIEAIVLILAQAVADIINAILFSVTSLLSVSTGGSAPTSQLQYGLDKVNDTLSNVNSTIVSLDIESVKSAIGKFLP